MASRVHRRSQVPRAPLRVIPSRANVVVAHPCKRRLIERREKVPAALNASTCVRVGGADVPDAFTSFRPRAYTESANCLHTAKSAVDEPSLGLGRLEFLDETGEHAVRAALRRRGHAQLDRLQSTWDVVREGRDASSGAEVGKFGRRRAPRGQMRRRVGVGELSGQVDDDDDEILAGAHSQ